MLTINKLLYISCVCSEKTEHKLFEMDAKSVGLQIQKYHRLLLKGFEKNGVQVTAISSHLGLEKLQIDTESEENITYTYIREKWKRLVHLEILIRSFFKSYKYFKENANSILICDVLSVSNSLGAIVAAKICGKRVIGIITDFPEQLSSSNKLYSKVAWMVISMCSSYVVMTPFMAEKLHPRKDKIVLEGHVEVNSIDEKLRSKSEMKKCVYAGTLHEKYGIKKLIKAFIEADVANAELHIFGNGDCAEWIKNLNISNIVYHGIWENSEIIEFEKTAHLLVNPRPTDEEYTKYSFPSKNMEYMVSGTPVLTTVLPGMPKEYMEYIYLFDDETVLGMSNSLRNILNRDVSELIETGQRAKKFVLEKKNNKVQAKRIIDKLFV